MNRCFYKNSCITSTTILNKHRGKTKKASKRHLQNSTMRVCLKYSFFSFLNPRSCQNTLALTARKTSHFLKAFRTRAPLSQWIKSVVPLRNWKLWFIFPIVVKIVLQIFYNSRNASKYGRKLINNHKLQTNKCNLNYLWAMLLYLVIRFFISLQ